MTSEPWWMNPEFDEARHEMELEYMGMDADMNHDPDDDVLADEEAERAYRDQGWAV